MLVYANHLAFGGAPAKDAALRAIGGWLKEHLGFGLHPAQLLDAGEFSGTGDNSTAWLRVDSAAGDAPAFHAWTLKHTDSSVHGRQWITEIGLRIADDDLDLSCVVETDERSTLVAEPTMVSRPRVINYLVNNIQSTPGAYFSDAVPSLHLKSIGQDADTYRAYAADVERLDRRYPLVVISPDVRGDYYVDVSLLQPQLLGLAQIVQIVPGFSSYDMAAVAGQRYSAWSGAINLVHVRRPNGFVFSRLFLSEEIQSWGDARRRAHQILAWVTHQTNLPNMRSRIRPEGIRQLSLRRRLARSHALSEGLDTKQLRAELDSAWQLAAEMEAEKSKIEGEIQDRDFKVLELQEELEEERSRVARKNYEIQTVKDQLQRAGGGRVSAVDVSILSAIACQADQPTPEQCLDVLAEVHGDKCIVLDTARGSARSHHAFRAGRRLLGRLITLVTDYRSDLIDKGDGEARKRFPSGEFAAQESETVMGNQAARRARVFSYDGQNVEMFRHLKIGVADDDALTIRVHFHWDAERRLIVIGHCGRHLLIPGR